MFSITPLWLALFSHLDKQRQKKEERKSQGTRKKERKDEDRGRDERDEGKMYSLGKHNN